MISFFLFLLNVDIEVLEEETTEQQTENTRLLRGEDQNTTIVELISQSDLDEFLGRNVYEVEKILKAKNYRVEVVHEMTTVFPDYNESRIRLFHDDNDVIVVIPEIG